MASAKYRLGGTALKRISSDLDKITPSEYFPVSFRADRINAFCDSFSLRNRAIFSTSSGGMLKRMIHSIMLRSISNSSGKSSTFWVDSQNQVLSFRHILVILAT